MRTWGRNNNGQLGTPASAGFLGSSASKTLTVKAVTARPAAR